MVWGVGLKQRGESGGKEGGDSDSQLQHLRENGENDVLLQVILAPGGYIHTGVSPHKASGYTLITPSVMRKYNTSHRIALSG